MKKLIILIGIILLSSCAAQYPRVSKIPYKNCKTYKGKKHKYHQRHLRHDGCDKI